MQELTAFAVSLAPVRLKAATPVTAPVSTASSVASLQSLEAVKSAPVLDTASEASEASEESDELSAIFPEEQDDLNASNLEDFGPIVEAIAAAEENSKTSAPLLLRDATPEEKFVMKQDVVLKSFFHGNANNSSLFKYEEQMRQLAIHADLLKTNQEQATSSLKTNQEQAKEHLADLIHTLTTLGKYEVSSMQVTLQDHVLALAALKIDSNTDLDNVKDRLKAVKATLDKTSYGTLGGVASEQTAFSVFYADAVRAVQQALNSITKLCVGEAGIEKNVVAEALLGQSFFFQSAPTENEQAVIDIKKEASTRLTAELEEINLTPLG